MHFPAVCASSRKGKRKGKGKGNGNRKGKGTGKGKGKETGTGKEKVSKSGAEIGLSHRKVKASENWCENHRGEKYFRASAELRYLITFAPFVGIPTAHTAGYFSGNGSNRPAEADDKI